MPSENAVLMTAEELEHVDIPGKKTELIRGRLLVSEPPGFYHGRVVTSLIRVLGNHITAGKLGVLVTESGFHIEHDPDTVRSPDVAFVTTAKANLDQRRGFGQGAPDLVVEVISPNDRKSELLSKVGDWLDAGVRLIWVIDPLRQEAHIHRADGSLGIVPSDGILDGEDVLPGFRHPLVDIF